MSTCPKPKLGCNPSSNPPLVQTELPTYGFRISDGIETAFAADPWELAGILDCWWQTYGYDHVTLKYPTEIQVTVRMLRDEEYDRQRIAHIASVNEASLD